MPHERRDESSMKKRTKWYDEGARASLASLTQLRHHLTFTLAGLRIQQTAGDAAAAPWRHAAGLVHPDGDAMAVQFVAPMHPALHPAQSKLMREDEPAAQQLQPVPILPSLPLDPPEKWHSDAPQSPLWPTSRLGKADSPAQHRWGVSPRPPLHVSPTRTSSRGPRHATRFARPPSAGYGEDSPRVARPFSAASSRSRPMSAAA